MQLNKNIPATVRTLQMMQLLNHNSDPCLYLYKQCYPKRKAMRKIM